MLQQWLLEQSIGLHLEAPNREAVLAELVALLPSQTLSSRKKTEILERLLIMENFGAIAARNGIAIAHCSIAGLETPVASLGISRRGVAYPALDGESVSLFILIVFPETGRRVSPWSEKLISQAEAIFHDRFLRERLKISETQEEAAEIISKLSVQVGEDLREVAR